MIYSGCHIEKNSFNQNNFAYGFCGWCCGSETVGDIESTLPPQQPQSNLLQSRSIRGQAQVKDNAATTRDIIGRLSGTTSIRSYVFQHLDSEDHMTAYREQLASPYAAAASMSALANLSPSAYNNQLRMHAATAPLLHARHQAQQLYQQQQQQQLQQQQQVLAAEEPPAMGINTTYFNGVWSVAQKYNLAPPSLTQCANWWRTGDKNAPATMVLGAGMPDMSDSNNGKKKNSSSHSAGIFIKCS